MTEVRGRAGQERTGVGPGIKGLQISGWMIPPHVSREGAGTSLTDRGGPVFPAAGPASAVYTITIQINRIDLTVYPR